MQIELIPATQDNFPVIAELAEIIWNKHYVPIIGKEQVDYMLGKMYSKQGLTEQQKVKHHRFYMIQHVAAMIPIGFISISNEIETDYWIHKFYVLDIYQGRGLGVQVFEGIKMLMPNMTSIRLTVNRQNFKSINFYFKLGFVIEQVADFDIGNGYLMNDFVMVWRKK